MYSTLPNFVLGFHGCDVSVYEKVINKKERLKASDNNFDWLGHGIYFWENNPRRAYEYALEKKKRLGNIEKAAVIGAIIDLGHCLNLMESNSLQTVKQAYDSLLEICISADVEIPQNKNVGNNTDLLKRHLDCAVIETVHELNKESEKKNYDSVRGLFIEGEKLYPNAGFSSKNHIQICVRNPNCIKGYFCPLDSIEDYCIP